MVFTASFATSTIFPIHVIAALTVSSYISFNDLYCSTNISLYDLHNAVIHSFVEGVVEIPVGITETIA